jgi:hypothetical protein
MGTVVQGGEYEYEKLPSRAVDSVFTYAGKNGGGDRDEIILRDSKAVNVMTKTRDLEKTTSRSIMPVFVFYTVDGSSSIWSMQQDLDIDPAAHYLWKHYVNLIDFCLLMQSYKNATHPVPATIIMNPDFFGEVHKSCGEWYCPIPRNQPVKIKDALQEAISYLNEQGYNIKVTIPAEFMRDDTQLKDYVASINWIIHTFAPDVSFAWQDNVWAGDESGHKWLHQAATAPEIIAQHVQNETSFLQDMGLFSNADYKPNFIVFDKWERDEFDKTLNGAGVNNGYLYNVNDWNVYLEFVKGMSQSFANIPVMLWQIPGGHLQVSGDLDSRDDHAATAPSYFFGDTNLNDSLSNLKSYISSYSIDDPSVYYTTSHSVVDYLRLGLSADSQGWHYGHMSKVRDSNVFAILWGGGSTTGVVGLSDYLDDNGWLYQKITAYYQR